MNPSDNKSHDHFSWADFERLEELCESNLESDDDQQNHQLPDATYRQVISLNETLMARAKFLYQKEQELDRRQQDLDLLRTNLESKLFRQSREVVEARLERLVKFPKSAAIPQDSLLDSNIEDSNIDCSDENPIDFVPIDEQPLDSNGKDRKLERANQIPGGPDPSDLENVANRSELTISNELETEKTLEESATEMRRLQHSAAALREKSEVISAVFVELDQMVRELSRQQELLDQLQISQQSNHSSQELQMVSEKLKRRFHRLSKQINSQ